MYSTYKFYRLFLNIGLFSILLFSCGGSGGEDEPNTPPEPTVITPSNLILTVSIVGIDTNNPNGDGTGVIQCTASATDAVNFGFRFGDGSEYNSSGNIEFTYTNNGINTYTVYVLAYSSTGHSISTSKEITVFVAPNDSFSTLIWSDEFDTNGSPDSSKWGYDIGAGGWGNNESQYYTSRSDNVIVEDGFLKIIAKKESYSGAEYTSTRMLSMGKFDFTYGRVEVRAKLPSGDGTWPAIWMLGANFQTVGWPTCGEIDIMEHAGIRQGIVSSALHTPSSSGNTSNHGDQYLSDVSTAFHVYSLEWNNEEMIFSVDDVEHYRYNPSTKDMSTWPYDAPQFLILNVAMGGTFGGTIDPNFTESSMEIDYVRVYQ